MKENTVIWNEYPEYMEVALPAKWIKVAEDLLTEDQYKDWLFYSMRYMGSSGIILSTGDTVLDMLLHAVYKEDEDFFDNYWNSLLKKRNKKEPLDQLLKVSKIYSKEDQLNDYTKRQRT